MEISKKVKITLAGKEVFAFQLVGELLQDICEACVDMGCEQTCPFADLCDRINYPPHHIVQDIANCIDNKTYEIGK